jgi:hypothetical protein
MWRKVHILSPVQSLIVASISAAVISAPLTMKLVVPQQTGFHIPLWPDAFDPYVNFSAVLMGVISPLLGYYHLGRLGFLVSLASGFAVTWSMAVCAILCFYYLGRYWESAWLSFGTYVACVALVYLVVAWLHLRAARSSTFREAQRKLGLV